MIQSGFEPDEKGDRPDTLPGVSSVDAEGLRFGDYVLEEEIAHGGMGVVYRARQRSLGRTVAVKLLLLGRYSSSESIERFRREAQSAAALRHPNIVAIHEIGEHEGQQFFSMDFVDGDSLAKLVRAGPLATQRSAEIVCVIARAIHYAHEQGVLHRDLKPSNVLLDVFGQVRITDFGLAKKLDGSSDLTLTGQLFGTPNYLSPEQAGGEQSSVGVPSDVYSIGALLYELLTGRPPFLANSLQETLLRIQDSEPVSPRALNPTVQKDLETVCLKCLRKESARRYTSALALALDLERWLSDRPIEARPVGLPERTWLWAKRRPRQALMLAGALMLSIALFVTLIVDNLRVGAANRRTQLKAAESLHRLAQLNVATGNRLVSDGDWSSALLWFVEALRLEQGDPQLEEIHRRRIGAVVRMGPRISQLFVHDGPLNWAELSADASYAVTVGVDGLMQVWDVATGQPSANPITPPGGATAARLTREGRYLLSIAGDRSVQIWDARTSEPIGAPRRIAATDINAIDFCDDGKWFAMPTMGGVELFDAVTMQPLEKSLLSTNLAYRVRFSPDSRLLAVVESSGAVRFWDLTSRSRTNHSLQLPAPATALFFDRAGKRLGLLTHGSRVQVCEVETGVLLGPPMEHPATVYSADIRADGRWIATACWDGLVRLWDIDTGKPARAPLPHGSGVRQVKFSRDGSRLITVTWDSVVRVWDPDSGQTIFPLIRQVGFSAMLSMTPDASRLLVCSRDPAARLWDLPANRPARLTMRHEGSTIEQAHFSPDAKSILTSSEDQTAKIRDAATGDVRCSMSHPGVLRISCFSPDGQTVATGSSEGSTRIWDAKTGSLQAETKQAGRVSYLFFAADNSRFATGASSGTVQIWQTSDGRPIAPAITHNGMAAMAISSDGTRLLTGSEDGTARLWDADGKPVGSVMKHRGPVLAVAISPDAELLVTACCDTTTLPYAAQLWDANTCLPVGQSMPHMDGIRSVSFSHDGLRIATGGEDNCAQIWSGTTGERLTPALPHSGYVYGAYFSPDSRLLLTVSEDSTARVWDCRTGEPVTPPLRHESRVHFGAWRPDGHEVITCSNDGTASVWDVSPTQSSLAELQLRAEIMSAHYLKPNIGALPLEAGEIKSRWQALQSARRVSKE